MRTVVGYITYGVEAECPHCKRDLNLYIDSDEDEENELGICVFGGIDKPANWNSPNIEIKCFYCKEAFILGSLEI